MIKTRTKLAVKMQSPTVNSTMEFPKGVCLINVMCSLIKFTGIDLVKARTKLNQALDEAESKLTTQNTPLYAD